DLPGATTPVYAPPSTPPVTWAEPDCCGAAGCNAPGEPGRTYRGSGEPGFYGLPWLYCAIRRYQHYAAAHGTGCPSTADYPASPAGAGEHLWHAAAPEPPGRRVAAGTGRRGRYCSGGAYAYSMLRARQRTGTAAPVAGRPG